jgi:putative ABC transport system permease protein
MKSAGGKSAMYFRMLRRAALLRKGQAAAALASIIVAAAASTAMLNLYVDVQVKLRREFRKFGANIIVQAKPGQSLPAQTLQQISSGLGGHGLAVPFSYAVARAAHDQPVVVVGTDIESVRRLNPWWSVSAWPARSHDALVGVRAARALNLDHRSFTLAYQGHQLDLISAGTVQTGAGEDSRIYLSQADFHDWTGIDPSVIEIAASGPPDEVSSVMNRLQRSLPQADVQPVRQVTEAEANVLAKTRSTLLWSASLIVTIAALCVLATLMGWVFDRRRDFAIMKALGASDRVISAFVAGEAAVLGLTGAVLGFAAGVGLADWIGVANFGSAVSIRFGILPAIVTGCLATTLTAALLPLRLLRAIQPAMILRGE